MVNGRSAARLLLALTVAAAPVLGGATAAHAAAPVNDEWASATVVPGLPFTDHVSTAEATTGPDDVDCGVDTVWYTFTPAESAQVEFHTTGSEYDAKLALFAGEPSASTLVGCYIDYPADIAGARAVANVTAGTTYYVSLGAGSAGWGGNLVFTAEINPAPLTKVDVTTRTATVTRDGRVTVTGTLTCDQPATGNVWVTVTQQSNRGHAEGAAGAGPISCGPHPTTWSVQLSSVTATAFGPGRATVDTNAAGEDRNGFVDADPEPKRMSLRGQ